MDSTIFTVMFIASAPFVLMPSAVALFAKSKHAGVIVAANFLVWAALYYLLRSVVVSESIHSLALSVPMSRVAWSMLALVVWLVLLSFAINGRVTATRG